MNIDQVTVRLIAEEGEILHVYPDHLGYQTLGVGRLVDPRKGGGITREESRYLLRNDIARRTAQCESRFEWWHTLDAVRQQVLVCMAFQLGIDGVCEFKRMIAALALRNYARAADEMLDSDWYREDTPERAKRMADMMRSGVWR